MGAAASFTKDRLTADEARQLAGDDWNPELFDQLKGDDGCVSMDQLRAVHVTEESTDDEDTSVLGTRALAVGLQHTRTSMMHHWGEHFPADPLPAHDSGMSTALLLFEGRCVVLLRGGI